MLKDSKSSTYGFFQLLQTLLDLKIVRFRELLIQKVTFEKSEKETYSTSSMIRLLHRRWRDEIDQVYNASIKGQKLVKEVDDYFREVVSWSKTNANKSEVLSQSSPEFGLAVSELSQ